MGRGRSNGGLGTLIFNLYRVVTSLLEGENQTMQEIFVDHSAELENE